MEHKDASDLDRIPFYYSRPDLRPPRLNIAVRDAARATPGLLFVAPTFNGDYKPDSGPYIFDTNGVSLFPTLFTVPPTPTPTPYTSFSLSPPARLPLRHPGLARTPVQLTSPPRR